MEYNRYRDPSVKSRECDNIPFNFNNNRQKKAVRVTNTTESPYTINKNIQIADFSAVTPEQSKFIKPVDKAILSMIPEGQPDLIDHLTEVLRTNKPDEQDKIF